MSTSKIHKLSYIIISSIFFTGILFMFPKETFACHQYTFHRDHTHSGEGEWKQEVTDRYDPNTAAAMGKSGPRPEQISGAYDNIIFTNLAPGKYKVRTRGNYGGQSDEHMVFESSDGNQVTLYDLDGSAGSHRWLWGEKEIDMNQPGGWIKIRAYSQTPPAVCSLDVDEVVVELIEPSARPDLTAEEPTLNSGVLDEGSSITFAGDVENDGEADATGTFDNEFQIDVGYSGSYNDPEDTILSAVSSITNLLIGQTKQVLSLVWSNVPLGTHAVRLCADASTLDPDPVPSNGLVGYWKLDDESGTIALDSSGNGNTGILMSSPTWTTGTIDGALLLDGNNDYINVDDSASLSITGDLTMTAWVNISNQSGYRTILCKQAKSTHTEPYCNYGMWRSWPNQSKWQLRINNKTSDWGTAVYNEWIHLACTFDDSANIAECYENGLKVFTSSIYTFDDSPEDSIYPLRIGSTISAGGEYLPGSIDEVSIYNRALSEGEILNIYARGISGSVIAESDETNNCSPPYVFSIPPGPECSDLIDNDSDDLTDEDDPGCWIDPSDSDTYDEDLDAELLIIDPLLNAAPDPISQGDSATLSWACYDSTTASGFGEGFSTGDQTTGSIAVSPIDTTTYTVQCFNGSDNRGQTSEEIIVLDIPTVSIDADSEIVRSGNATTITWTSSDVDSCSVSGPGGLISTDLSGSASTGPITEESIYTIVCQNILDQASAQVRVTILPKFDEL